MPAMDEHKYIKADLLKILVIFIILGASLAGLYIWNQQTHIFTAFSESLLR